MMGKKKIKQDIRPPIVAVLGHVDHGKTTLLDAIRKTDLSSEEPGGITQHIGAYQIEFQNRRLTFIDTPGHAAFAKMRSRGGKAADVVLLVVAGDDGVKPQTIESIKHIKEAKVPFIIVITKMDLSSTSPDKVKKQLAQENVLVEGYGGDVVCVEVSAEKKQGLEELLEMIFLVYDMNPVKSLSKSSFNGLVIESQLDRFCGPLATVLVKQGQLKIGDKVLAKDTFAKIKNLTDFKGKKIKKAVSGQPVEVLGFKHVPPVGAQVISTEKTKAKQANSTREVKPPKKTDEDKLYLILKTDTLGTLEAIKNSLSGQEAEIIYSSVGEINESDVLLAETTKADVLGFNVRIPNKVKKLAETEKVSISSFEVIYDLLKSVEEKIAHLTGLEAREEVLGQLEILKEFNIRGSHIAGCKVLSGQVSQGSRVHLAKEDKTINAKVVSLQQGKQEVKLVKKNEECGLVLKPDVNFQPGDKLTVYRSNSD